MSATTGLARQSARLSSYVRPIESDTRAGEVHRGLLLLFGARASSGSKTRVRSGSKGVG